MKNLLTAAVFLLVVFAFGCDKNASPKNNTVILGGAHNMNAKCVGHATGLCGTEDEMLPVEIAGVFATEPECQGLKLRGLTEQEKGTPSNQLPLLFELFYEGRPHADFYQGTGRDEDEGWMFLFNGPNGHFSGTAKTERDAVRRVCLATKGKGAEIDQSVGYTH